MLQHRSKTFARFTSVLLYPSGNTHCAHVVSEYPELLRVEARATRFVAMTYESFLAFLLAQSSAPKVVRWLDYLARRYAE